MKNKILALVFIASLFVVGCGPHDELSGQWRLLEYCYGNDCTEMEQYDILQTWVFGSKELSESDLMLAGVKAREGRQLAESTMDIQMGWARNAAGDSLFICDLEGMNCDTFAVVRLDVDTLVLQSGLNDSLVRQTFIRL